jgi:hypothetical protein
MSFGSAPAGENRPAPNSGAYNPDPAEHEEEDLFGNRIRIGSYERQQYEVEVPAGLTLFSMEVAGDTPLGIALYDIKGGLLAAEPVDGAQHGGIACGLMVEAEAPMTIVIEVFNPSKFNNGYVLWMN